jgi:hypothetical protein
MGLKQWRESLLMSRRKFVWQLGMAWGVTTGVIVAALLWQGDLRNHPTWEKVLAALGIFALCVAAGPLWGWLTWHGMQWQRRSRRGVEPSEDQKLALALTGAEVSDEEFCREHSITPEKLADIRERRIVIIAGFVAQMQKADPKAFKPTGPTIEIRGEQHDKAYVEDGIEYCLTKTWRQATWEARDTVRYKPDELVRPYEGKGYNSDNAEFVKGGWDHDHCELCWWTLDDRDDPAHNTGWVNDNDNWLCNDCYARFIQPRLGS